MVPASASQVSGFLPSLGRPLVRSPKVGHCRARERSGGWRRRATLCTLTCHNDLSQGVGRTGGVLPEPAAARLPSVSTAASSTARLGRAARRAALQQHVGQQVTSTACALRANRALSTTGV
jgi:hypothetical protein